MATTTDAAEPASAATFPQLGEALLAPGYASALPDGFAGEFADRIIPHLKDRR